jgi:HSP20 family molecular chaperone IbpA
LAQAGEPKRAAGGSSDASPPIRLLDSFDLWTGPKSCFKESAPGHAASWSPAVEIEQRDDNLVITAELPGLGLEDIKVEAIGNVLILQGERRRDRGAGRRTLGRSERGCGYFYREIVLPDGVDAAGAG